jgi:hypothetical protein
MAAYTDGTKLSGSALLTGGTSINDANAGILLSGAGYRTDTNTYGGAVPIYRDGKQTGQIWPRA